ncbi:hypothetical protein KDK95_02255 [Actinospica sp. MGRD01-02]|uniref:Uncharacterized protein n=1 Tax=Actinospica acidithermotolerans TaxID=2828514 RepID=A0A941E716_9ACTN|nr:hypothetical protein [Actinospica acidithermotolerans]MBR7825113.1 hypothetical protein [Actinospica acidithermotolerans]
MAPRLAGFTGPVVVAADVPEGLIALPGFQEADGRPWSVQVRYRDPGDARRRVVVRTTRGALDWTPVIGTVENVYTVMANCEARPVEPVLEHATLVEVDDAGAVPGVRIDCRDGDCAVAFDWQGQHVYVVGVRELVDGLRLRSGAVADFEAYDAAHLARYGPGAQ